jgi:hypothetical protein
MPVSQKRTVIVEVGFNYLAEVKGIIGWLLYRNNRKPE